MAKGSSRQEGQDALSERIREEVYPCGDYDWMPELEQLQVANAMWEKVANGWKEMKEQLEAENDSLRQLHTAQMEENERLWAIRDSLAELLEPDEPHDLGGPHISIPWVIARFDALKEGE